MQTHVQLYGVRLHVALFSIIILNKISRRVLIDSDSHLSSVLTPYLTKEVFLVESADLVSKKNTICITDGSLHELSVLLSKLAAGCDHVPITGWMSSLKKWLVWFFLNLQSCLLCLMKHFVHRKGFLSILEAESLSHQNKGPPAQEKTPARRDLEGLCPRLRKWDCDSPHSGGAGDDVPVGGRRQVGPSPEIPGLHYFADCTVNSPPN